MLSIFRAAAQANDFGNDKEYEMFLREIILLCDPKMVATIKIDVGNPSLVQRLLDAFIPSGSVDKSEQDLKTRCFQ